MQGTPAGLQAVHLVDNPGASICSAIPFHSPLPLRLVTSSAYVPLWKAHSTAV